MEWAAEINEGSTAMKALLKCYVESKGHVKVHKIPQPKESPTMTIICTIGPRLLRPREWICPCALAHPLKKKKTRSGFFVQLA